MWKLEQPRNNFEFNSLINKETGTRIVVGFKKFSNSKTKEIIFSLWLETLNGKVFNIIEDKKYFFSLNQNETISKKFLKLRIKKFKSKVNVFFRKIKKNLMR